MGSEKRKRNNELDSNVWSQNRLGGGLDLEGQLTGMCGRRWKEPRDVPIMLWTGSQIAAAGSTEMARGYDCATLGRELQQDQWRDWAQGFGARDAAQLIDPRKAESGSRACGSQSASEWDRSRDPVRWCVGARAILCRLASRR